jgi:hypothetical protein
LLYRRDWKLPECINEENEGNKGKIPNIVKQWKRKGKGREPPATSQCLRSLTEERA